MNVAISDITSATQKHGRRAAPWKPSLMQVELSILGVIIALLNLPLLKGACALDFIFMPDRVLDGEWWRVFTHPFVHVSWYHLLLDASAFFLLYQGLGGKKWSERIACLAACGAGSLLVALWAAAMIQDRGLCGLSGIAHGLMVVSALDMMQMRSNPPLWRAGLVTFVVVVTKCLIESATGEVMLASLHFGRLGMPIAVCHAGGALGGLMVWLMLKLRRNHPDPGHEATNSTRLG